MSTVREGERPLAVERFLLLFMLKNKQSREDDDKTVYLSLHYVGVPQNRPADRVGVFAGPMLAPGPDV